MHNKLILLGSLLVLCFAVKGQDSNRKRSTHEFNAPNGVVFLMVQPGCPVSIVETQLLTDERGNYPELRYVLKNNTPSEIASVTVDFYHKHNVALWSKYGNGWSDTTGNVEMSTALIGPYGTYENLRTRDTKPFENSMTSELDQRKEETELLGFWVGFVSKVVFRDGREYTLELNSEDFWDLLANPRLEP